MINSKYIFLKATIKQYDDYFKIRSEESNLFWTGYEEPPKYEEFKNWFIERINNTKRDIYLMYLNEECLGSLHIDFEDNYVAIGYSIMKSQEGKGYGTALVQEAVNVARLSKQHGKDIDLVKAWINFQNIASIKVIEKNGFYLSENNKVKMRFGREELYYEYALKL